MIVTLSIVLAAMAIGCEQGPPPHEDACAAHEGEDICNGDTTIGCKWNADKGKCESAH
jgi:hypothetical protein